MNKKLHDPMAIKSNTNIFPDPHPKMQTIPVN